MQCVKNYAEAVFVAAKEPFVVELEASKRYSWCACGRSKKQVMVHLVYQGLKEYQTVFRAG